jgi:hypothetical protein
MMMLATAEVTFVKIAWKKENIILKHKTHRWATDCSAHYPFGYDPSLSLLNEGFSIRDGIFPAISRSFYFTRVRQLNCEWLMSYFSLIQ